MAAKREAMPGSAMVIARMTRLRLARRWTQQELGRHTSMGAVIANMESGRRKVVTVDELLSLARAFGIQPMDLLGGDCARCGGKPPEGFTCGACGAGA